MVMVMSMGYNLRKMLDGDGDGDTYEFIAKDLWKMLDGDGDGGDNDGEWAISYSDSDGDSDTYKEAQFAILAQLNPLLPWAGVALSGGLYGVRGFHRNQQGISIGISRKI